MSQPTPEQVRAFYAHMLDHFGASVVNKQNAVEMQGVALLLSQLGILDHSAFLKRFATTLGRRIYVPFEVGEPQEGWSLWSQITVCAHECQHVVQYDRYRPLGFAWQYVATKAGRARLEAEAYRCQLELHFWRTGEILPAHELAASLQHYGVSDTDVKTAETMLRVSGESVRRGAIVNRASAVAIDWLTRHAPELRTAGG